MAERYECKAENRKPRDVCFDTDPPRRQRRLESREAARNRLPTFEHSIPTVPLAWKTNGLVSSLLYPARLLSAQAISSPKWQVDRMQYPLPFVHQEYSTQGLNDTAARNDALENASDSRAYLSNPIWWAGMSTRMSLFFFMITYVNSTAAHSCSRRTYA